MMKFRQQQNLKKTFHISERHSSLTDFVALKPLNKTGFFFLCVSFGVCVCVYEVEGESADEGEGGFVCVCACMFLHTDVHAFCEKDTFTKVE
jgi:hypothetical protein